jgi:hypothetical protein
MSLSPDKKCSQPNGRPLRLTRRAFGLTATVTALHSITPNLAKALPYERLGKAAKAGSKARLPSYNPWIQARGTDFQDFQFGEGFTGSQNSASGVWPDWPMKGLHAHGNFQIDRPDCGINKPDIRDPTSTLQP